MLHYVMNLENGIDLSPTLEVKTAVRRNAETETTWKYHDIAKRLYTFTDIFRQRLIQPILKPDQEVLPSPVIGFDYFDVRTLAYYRLGKNAYGIDDEIIFNERHLDRPMYSILETLLHEQLHLWQQRHGEHPVKKNYHNEEFVTKAENLGLHPFPIVGFHWKPADGLFQGLLLEHGIRKPEEVWEVEEGEKRDWWIDPDTKKKGRSTLHKWACPRCDLNIRVGVQRDIELACLPCSRETGQTVILARREK